MLTVVIECSRCAQKKPKQDYNMGVIYKGGSAICKKCRMELKEFRKQKTQPNSKILNSLS
jgi:hypothetical protein